MMDFNSYVEYKVQDWMREAEGERLVKQAVEQAKAEGRKRSLREALGERLILLGWRMLNKAPGEGETCSRLVLSGSRQAMVMVEVCL
jgi:hypothetical protein